MLIIWSHSSSGQGRRPITTSSAAAIRVGPLLPASRHRCSGGTLDHACVAPPWRKSLSQIIVGMGLRAWQTHVTQHSTEFRIPVWRKASPRFEPRLLDSRARVPTSTSRGQLTSFCGRAYGVSRQLWPTMLSVGSLAALLYGCCWRQMVVDRVLSFLAPIA